MKDLNELYQNIVDIVGTISDFEWEQAVIWSAMDETHSSIGVFYKMNGKFELISKLVNEGLVDKNTYNMALFDLLDAIMELKGLTREHGISEWNSMYLSIKSDKKYEVNYSFEEWDETSMRDEIVWRYKYLNIIPKEANMKYIEGVEQTLL